LGDGDDGDNEGRCMGGELRMGLCVKAIPTTTTRTTTTTTTLEVCFADHEEGYVYRARVKWMRDRKTYVKKALIYVKEKRILVLPTYIRVQQHNSSGPIAGVAHTRVRSAEKIASSLLN
jgi:hypothetical protein